MEDEHSIFHLTSYIASVAEKNDYSETLPKYYDIFLCNCLAFII
ncbi:MAG: hypothetical protein K0S32_27 [Bacteroidetes bacterium]|jgi:hypothetical protein|nr:hypothetical protein [Bacteroidota bacterium]